MHPSETVPHNVGRIRGVCQHSPVGSYRVSTHTGREHAVQRVARFVTQVCAEIGLYIVLDMVAICMTGTGRLTKYYEDGSVFTRKLLN